MAYLYALEQTKLKESMEIKKDSKQNINNDINKLETKDSEYPSGIEGIMNETRYNIGGCFGKVNGTIVRTNVIFVVDESGMVTRVNAKGDNVDFNKCAEIAIYLLSQRFYPSVKNGVPVRSHYSFPIGMKL